MVGADGSVWTYVLEREKEDNGRAVFGGRKAVFMPYVAGLGQGSPRRGREGWQGLSRVRMIGYFIDDAKSTSIFQLPSKGIECKACLE